jgi:hypothetical protein
MRNTTLIPPQLTQKSARSGLHTTWFLSFSCSATQAVWERRFYREILSALGSMGDLGHFKRYQHTGCTAARYRAKILLIVCGN